MSFHVKDDFKAGMPISAIGVDWFNKVAGFLNALAGGTAVTMRKPSNPSASVPISINVDPDRIREIVGDAKAEAPSETTSLASGMSLTSQNLASRKTDTFQAGAAGGKGCKCYLCFRGAVDGMGNGALYFREVTITSDGRIFFVDKEAGTALQVYHSTE